MINVESLAGWVERGQYALPLALFAFLVALEAWQPAQRFVGRRHRRWPTNLGLHALGIGIFTAIGPTSLVIAALLAIGGPHVGLFAPVGRWGGAWAVLVASAVSCWT